MDSSGFSEIILREFCVIVSVVNEAEESQAFSMRAVATVGGHLPLRVNSGESV